MNPGFDPSTFSFTNTEVAIQPTRLAHYAQKSKDLDYIKRLGIELKPSVRRYIPTNHIIGAVCSRKER